MLLFRLYGCSSVENSFVAWKTFGKFGDVSVKVFFVQVSHCLSPSECWILLVSIFEGLPMTDWKGPFFCFSIFL